MSFIPVYIFVDNVKYKVLSMNNSLYDCVSTIDVNVKIKLYIDDLERLPMIIKGFRVTLNSWDTERALEANRRADERENQMWLCAYAKLKKC